MEFHINSSKVFGRAEIIYCLSVQELLVLNTLSMRTTPTKNHMAFNLVTMVHSLWAISMVSMFIGCEYYGESSRQDAGDRYPLKLVI